MQHTSEITGTPLCFVDLETSGASAIYDRIIEVAIIVVHEGRVLKEYSSLVNPGCPVSSFIEEYTGISNTELETAPSFGELAGEIFELLNGKLFVAHNVRFDFSFLKNELLRHGLKWDARQICTVKLSRRLYPEHRRHSLDALIERHGFHCHARHRAMGDARVMWNFWEHVHDTFPQEEISGALDIILKRPTVPVHIDETQLNALPSACGVYVFSDKDGVSLYVGKSLDIRSRVLSHFSGDMFSGKEMRISDQAHNVEYFETPGEFSALVLESQLIKKLQPLYNQRLRPAQENVAFELVANTDGYLELKTLDTPELSRCDWSRVYGVFRTKKKATQALAEIADHHHLCHKFLGLEKMEDICCALPLKKCRGACCGEETPESFNLRLKVALAGIRCSAWPFSGVIGIRERDEERDLFEIHLAYNWCILGTARSEAELSELIENLPPPEFRRDQYRLLQKYLAMPAKNFEIIRNLTTRDL